MNFFKDIKAVISSTQMKIPCYNGTELLV